MKRNRLDLCLIVIGCAVGVPAMMSFPEVYGQPPTDGLVACYHFEGDATDPCGGHDGTVHEATLVCGIKGMAYEFDGGTSYIDSNYVPMLQPEDSISIAFWARLPGQVPQPANRMMGLEVSGAQEISFQSHSTHVDSPVLYFRDDDNRDTTAQSSVNPYDGNWHHFVGIRDGTGDTVKLYIDGGLQVSVSDDTESINLTDPRSLYFGASNHPNGTNSHVSGVLDEILIYDRPLNEQEIQGLAIDFDDCNGNGVPDERELEGNDSNGNCIPDECEAVPLDIKPGSCPNPLNRNSHGVLPVALLGGADFDIASVDVSSVRLSRADGVGGDVAPNEGPPGPHSTIDDVATPFVASMECECDALGADGFVDLSMKFKTDDVVAALELNALPAGDLVPLFVTGTLLDGTPFQTATDCIRLVPPGTPPGMLTVESNISATWVAVSPLDIVLDAGGFAAFDRVFPQGTVVTLTAEATMNGRPFIAWQIDGVTIAASSLTRQIVITDDSTTVRAIYRSMTSNVPLLQQSGLDSGTSEPN